jgi:hypothetical protein
MKYVIGRNEKAAHLLSVAAFGDETTHVAVAAAMKMSGYMVVSAGFCRPAPDGTITVGEEASESLGGLGPGPYDAEVLRLFLYEGLSGIDLANMIMYRLIETAKASGRTVAPGELGAAVRGEPADDEEADETPPEAPRLPYRHTTGEERKARTRKKP